MAFSNITRVYPRADFTSLSGSIPLPLLRTALSALTLTVSIADVRFAVQPNAVIVQWLDDPTDLDIAAVDAAIAAFTGGTTTSEPFEFNSFGVATAPNGTPVTKITQTTPPLDAGTYQVIWTSSIRMQAIIANTGVEGKIRLTRSDGVFVEQTDAWDRNANHAFNGALTFQIQAGQTITATLSFSRLGASGVAEMSGARITIDQISAAA